MTDQCFIKDLLHFMKVLVKDFGVYNVDKDVNYILLQESTPAIIEVEIDKDGKRLFKTVLELTGDTPISDIQSLIDNNTLIEGLHFKYIFSTSDDIHQKFKKSKINTEVEKYMRLI